MPIKTQLAKEAEKKTSTSYEIDRAQNYGIIHTSSLNSL